MCEGEHHSHYKNEILNGRGQEGEGTNLKLLTSDKIKNLLQL
jgi:hypothetical protein